MNELDGLSALIIEPHAGMRASIHNMLNLCGLTKIDHAGSSNSAIKHLGLKSFDLVLCEYDLEGGQDGQQLLEDLRHHKLIPLSTMFFMVTAEGNYGKVVSAAELAPDRLHPQAVHRRPPARAHRARAGKAQRVHAGVPADGGGQPARGDRRLHRGRSAASALRDRLHAPARRTAHVPRRAGRGRADLPAAGRRQGDRLGRLGLAKTLFLRERYDEAREMLEDLVDDQQEVRRRLRLAGAHPRGGRRARQVAGGAGGGGGGVAACGAAPAQAGRSGARSGRHRHRREGRSSRWSARPSTPNSAIRKTTSAGADAGAQGRPGAGGGRHPRPRQVDGRPEEHRRVQRDRVEHGARIHRQRGAPDRIADGGAGGRPGRARPVAPTSSWNWRATACRTTWKRARPK